MNNLTLRILAHYYAIIVDFPFKGAPAETDAVNFLLRNELLIELAHQEQTYEITEKGRALVNEWLKTPLPVAIWIVERN